MLCRRCCRSSSCFPPETVVAPSVPPDLDQARSNISLLRKKKTAQHTAVCRAAFLDELPAYRLAKTEGNYFLCFRERRSQFGYEERFLYFPFLAHERYLLVARLDAEEPRAVYGSRRLK